MVEKDLDFAAQLDALDKPDEAPLTGFGFVREDVAPMDFGELPGSTKQLIDETVGERQSEEQRQAAIDKARDILDKHKTRFAAERDKVLGPQAPAVSPDDDQWGGELFRSLGRAAVQTKDMAGATLRQSATSMRLRGDGHGGILADSVEQRGQEWSDEAGKLVRQIPAARVDSLTKIRRDSISEFARDTTDYLQQGLGQIAGFYAPLYAAYAVAGPVGLFGGSMILGVGEVRNALEEAGVTDPKLQEEYAWLGGMAIGALDALVPNDILTGQVKKGLGKYIITRIARTTHKIGKKEALTEAMQEAIKIAAAAEAAGIQIGEDRASEEIYNMGMALYEKRWELLDAAALGYMGGKTLGAPRAIKAEIEASRAERLKGFSDSAKGVSESGATIAPPEDTRTIAPSQEGPTPKLKPGEGAVRGATPSDPVLDDAERLLAEIGGETIASPETVEQPLTPAAPGAEPATAATAPDGFSSAVEKPPVPTFNDIAPLFKSDKDGAPDFAPLFDFLAAAGKRGFGELTDQEKVALRQTLKGETPAAPKEAAQTAPAAAPEAVSAPQAATVAPTQEAAPAAPQAPKVTDVTEVTPPAPQAPATAQSPAIEAQPIAQAGPTIGETRRLVTPDGSTEFDVTTELVDMADLRLASGEFQPRDRSRQESEAGVLSRAASLDPTRLMPGRVSDGGAPVVAPDGTIISGNGRVMSIGEVYSNPALADRAAAYRAALGPAAAGMERPVLIQRMAGTPSREDLIKIADLSNRTSLAGMSATERAMRDARAAGPGIMQLYTGGSFTSTENREFFRAFLNNVVTDSERGQISRNGVLTKEGEDRMSAAVLAAAYGDSELLARMLESTDDNIRNITGALRDAAGAFINLKQSIAAGQTSPEFDITRQLVETARRIADLRDRNIPLAGFLAQQDAFDRLDPVVEALLKSFYNDKLSRPLSRAKLTELLTRYAQEAEKHQAGGLIPDDTSPRDVISIARQRTLADDAGNQGDIFAPRPEPARAPDGGAGQETSRPTDAESRPGAREDSAAVQPDGDVGSVTDVERARFSEVLATKEKRSNWAAAAGLSEAQIKVLMDEALADGRLRMLKGHPVRTAKARAAAPATPVAAEAAGVATVPMGRATEKRLEAITNDLAYRYAAQLIAAAGNAKKAKAIVKKMRKEPQSAKGLTRAAVDQIYNALRPGAPRPKSRDKVFDEIEAAIGQAGLEGVFRDAPSRNPDLEPDWRDGPPADGLGEANVPAARGPDAEGVGAGGTAADADGGLDGVGGLFDGDAAAVGAGSDSEVQAGAPGVGSEPAGSGGSGRGGDPGLAGVPAGRIPAKEVGKFASDSTKLDPSEAQRIADETVPFVAGDLENISASLPSILPVHYEDIRKAEVRFAQPDGHGFLFTNGTGTGKTWLGAGILKRFAKQGKNNVLVLAPSQGILDGWIQTANAIGLPITRLDDTATAGEGMVATTYANLRDNSSLVTRNWDLIVADEAHTLSQNAQGNPSEALRAFRGLTNHSPAQRASMALATELADITQLEALAKEDVRYAPELEAAKKDWSVKHNALIEQYKTEGRTTKALFLSATPFAYRKSTDYAEGFLFDYPETTSSYNNPGGQAEFLARNFGYNIRYNRAEEPGAEVNVSVLEREFYERLKREGVLSGRRLEVDADYDRRFVLVDDAVGAKIDQALDWLSSTSKGRYQPLLEKINENFNYLAKRRLLEAIKAKHVIPRIQRDIELGRKVVVFHDYNEGSGFNPFEPPANPNERPPVRYGEPKPASLGELYFEFTQANPYVKKLDFSQFLNPIQTLTEAFPDAMVYNGTIPNKQRKRARDDFNKDGSGKDLIIVQSDAGEAGISLHDTSGKHQRVLYNLGLPTRPTRAIQQEGRIYRQGQVSDAVFRYMSTGTGWERTAFAQTIAERASTAENLALGDEARALRDSFINAFNDASEIEQGPDEGKGGKHTDRTMGGSVTPWERAKAFYFAEGKKKGRRDQREGKDYFATPEPIGFKMVEFADIENGERVLEPSAGHGAIARWFPEGANRFLIEPSSSLASRAGLNSPGAKVINTVFEDHYIGNKYDAVVMNPPFGMGGKEAFDHVQKALGHLREGGRVVAIVPRGPAADKRFDAMMSSDDNKNIYLAAQFEMPPVMFERAGTRVATRILILERHAKPETAPNAVYRDLSDAETINELFDRMEGLSLGKRRRGDQPAPAPLVQAIVEPPRPAPQPVTVQVSESAQRLMQAEELGAAAFVRGAQRVPAQDRDLMAMISGPVGSNVTLLDAWLRGWTDAQSSGTPTAQQITAAPTAPAPTAPQAAPVATAPVMKPAVAPAVPGVKFKLGETVHSKTGDDLFVASIAQFVPRQTYDQVLAIAKRNKGYYSTFKGRGAIPGFQFPDEASRKAFLDEVMGKPAEAADISASFRSFTPIDQELDAPNFGLPDPPQTLPDDHPLLVPRDKDMSPERVAMRERLIDQRFAGKTPVAEGVTPIVYLMGGGGASGKGTVLERLIKAGVVNESFVELDPDSFKTGTKEKGWDGIPEYQEIDAAGDSRGAAATYLEGSVINNAAIARAQADRYNVVVDQTLSRASFGEGLINGFKAAGYDVRLVGVTVDPESAVTRAVARAKATGRHVPPSALLAAHKGFSEYFEKYAIIVDYVALYDNGVPFGQEPITVAVKKPNGGLEIIDQNAYISFIRKGGLNEKATTLRELRASQEGLDAGSRGDDPGRVGRGEEGARPEVGAQRPENPASVPGQRLGQEGAPEAPLVYPPADSYAIRTLNTIDDPVVKGHYEALARSGTAVESALGAIASDRRLDAGERQQLAELYVGEPISGDPVEAIRSAAERRGNDLTSALLHGFDPQVSGSNLRVRDFDAQMLETAFQRLADRLPRDAILAVRSALRLDLGNEVAALEGASLSALAARVEFGINAGSAKKVIAVSLEYGPDTALKTFTHEEVHLLRALGIVKGKDWEALAGIAKRRPKKAEATRILDGLIANGKISQESYDALIGQAGKLTYRELYEVDARYGDYLKGNESLLIEETVAHAAADWADGRQFAAPIERVFMRIRDFLEAIQNALNGLGFRSANDIFESIWAGDFVRKFEEAEAKRAEGIESTREWMGGNGVIAMAVGSPSNLDMSPEARKARAESMGFDTSRVLYHGTKAAEFDAFRPSEKGKFGAGVYLTQDAQFANEWVGGQGRVIEVYVRGKMADDAAWAAAMDAEYTGKPPRSIFEVEVAAGERLQREGFAGVASKGRGETVIYDPNNIRSVDAAFDPAASDSPVLMAAFAGERATTADQELAGLRDQWRKLDAEHQRVEFEDKAMDADAAGERLEKLQETMHRLRQRADSILKGMTDEQYEALSSNGLVPEEWAQEGYTSPIIMAAFAGERAKTADQEALNAAKEMDAAGEPREDIWKQTGWFKGVDGRWRFEIDDSSSKLRAFGPDFSLLQVELTHEELFKAYPQMAEVNFNRGSSRGFEGEYTPGGIIPSTIEISKKTKDRRSVTLHESQHALQDIEGFAQGGDPGNFTYQNDPLFRFRGPTESAFQAYTRLAGEVESRTVQKRLSLTPQERANRAPWLDYDVPESQQIVRMPDGSGQAMASIDDASIGQSMRRDLDALGFYSGALEAAKSWNQKKGTPEQALMWLKKSGVKDAEIEATGLKAFLDGKKSVTQGEIVGHLEANKVGLTERVYDAPTREYGPFDNGQEEVAKWQQYSLDPSNPTYRETVLHLPERNWLAAAHDELRAKYGPQWNSVKLTPEEKAKLDAAHDRDSATPFASGHFSEPNIIGHMMTSMTTHQGKPVYTVDQIQSDWGQKLRDGGVRDEAKIAELRAEFSRLDKQVRAAHEAYKAGLDLHPDAVGNEGIQKLSQQLFGKAYADITVEQRLEMSKVASENNRRLSALDKTWKELRSERIRIEAEINTAEASSPGNPLVNTTDQWVNTTLRRAIRQAAEADAEYIAIPTGKTVLSYNPGDDAGMSAFYEQIVPKNLRNLLGKIDKASPGPERIDTLDSPSGKTGLGQGFTLFPLTDKAKSSVMTEGQPMFSFRDWLPSRGPTPPQSTPEGDSPGLNKIISDLRKTLGMPVSQGLWGMTVQQGARSARVRPPSNVRGQFDRETGNVSVRQSRDIKTLAHEGGHYLESILGADLGVVKQGYAEALTGDANAMPAALSEGFARWFESYILDPQAAEARAPGMTEAFEELLEAERPDMLGAFDTIQNEYQRYITSAPIGEVAAGLSSQYDGTMFSDLSKDKMFDNVTGWISSAYEKVVDQNNASRKSVEYLLQVASANGIVDAEGRPISLKASDNFYKRLRMFAGSFARGRSWLDKGVSDLETGKIIGPSLKVAVEKALGDGGFDKKRYKQFNEYLVSVRALAEYDRLDQKADTVKQYDDTLARLANARPTLADRLAKDSAALDRRQDALVRARARLSDRRRALGVTQTRLENIGERIAELNADIAEASGDNADAIVARRRRSIQIAERDQRQAFNAAGVLNEQVSLLENEVFETETEIEQLRETLSQHRERISQLEAMRAKLGKEREAATKRGASRPPTLDSRAVHERVVREYGTPEFQEAAVMVREFLHSLLRARHQAGFISTELFDELAKRKDWYVPFWRDMSDIPGAGSMFPGSGVKKWSMFKKFEGSDRSIIAPLEVISQEAYSTAQQIAFNDVVKTMVNLAESVGPGGGRIAERLSRVTEMEASNATFEKLKQDAIALGLDPVDAHMIVQRMEMNFSDGDIKVILSPENLGPTTLPQLPLWENGTRGMVRLPDRDFGKAIFDGVNAVGKDMSDILLKAFGASATAIRVGATTHWDFIGANIWRDMWQIFKIIGAAPVITHARGAKIMLGMGDVAGMPAEDFQRLYNEAGGVAGGINVNAQTALQQRDVKDLLDTNINKKGVAAGTAIGAGLGISTIGAAGGALGLLLGGPVGMAAGFSAGVAASGALGGYLGRHGEVFRVVEASETAGRIGVAAYAYKRAKAHNPDLTDTEAMFEAAFTARDLLDWNRRGSKMLVISRMVPFLSSFINGNIRNLQQMGAVGDRGSALKRQFDIVWKHKNNEQLSADERRDLVDSFKSYVRWGLLTGVLASMWMVMMAGDDDEDKQTYQDIKDKDRFIANWIKVNGTWVKFPVPHELAYPATAATILGDKLMGYDPRMRERLLDAAYETLSPPLIAGLQQQVGGLLYNSRRDGWFGKSRDVVPERLAKLPPHEQFDAYSTAFAMDLANAMHHAGVAQLSPKKIDFFLTSQFASWGREVGRAYETGKRTLGVSNRPEPRATDLPIVRRFVGDPARASKSVDEVYKIMSTQGGEMTTAAEGYKRMIDANRHTAAEIHLSTLEPEQKAYALTQLHAAPYVKRRHPLNYAKATNQATMEVQSDIVMDQLAPKHTRNRRKVRDFGREIELTPTKKTEVLEIMDRIRQVDSRNAMVLLNREGFQGLKIKDPQLIWDELEQSSPEVAKHLRDVRRNKKIPDWNQVSTNWASDREKALAKGPASRRPGEEE